MHLNFEKAFKFKIDNRCGRQLLPLLRSARARLHSFYTHLAIRFDPLMMNEPLELEALKAKESPVQLVGVGNGSSGTLLKSDLLSGAAAETENRFVSQLAVRHGAQEKIQLYNKCARWAWDAFPTTTNGVLKVLEVGSFVSARLHYLLLIIILCRNAHPI
jgi:hypothetical protein